MADFKCKQSGNVYKFELEHDINTMRKHPDYEEVTEEIKEEQKQNKRSKKDE